MPPSASSIPGRSIAVRSGCRLTLFLCLHAAPSLSSRGTSQPPIGDDQARDRHSDLDVEAEAAILPRTRRYRLARRQPPSGMGIPDNAPAPHEEAACGRRQAPAPCRPRSRPTEPLAQQPLEATSAPPPAVPHEGAPREGTAPVFASLAPEQHETDDRNPARRPRGKPMSARPTRRARMLLAAPRDGWRCPQAHADRRRSSMHSRATAPANEIPGRRRAGGR